jgi:hypothetical protein
MFAAFSKQAFEFGQQLLTQDDGEDADDNLDFETGDGMGIAWDWNSSNAASSSRADAEKQEKLQALPGLAEERENASIQDVPATLEEAQQAGWDPGSLKVCRWALVHTVALVLQTSVPD